MSFRVETWEGQHVDTSARHGGIDLFIHRLRYADGRCLQTREMRPRAPVMGGWLPDVFLRALTVGMRGLFGSES